MGMLPSGCPALLLERLGDSLAETVGPVSSPRYRSEHGIAFLLHVGSQVAQALANVHALGVVHRDLRPDNILFASLDQQAASPCFRDAYVIDFGLAKVFRPDVFLPVSTGDEDILGTDLYMAPEQCKSARAADDRSDVYSLGIILYEMLTADIPFDAETDAELLSMHMFQEPPSLSKRAPHINPGLAQLVHRMLRKEPAARPSAGEVAAELTQLLTSGGGEMAGASPLPRVREPGERVTLVSRPEPGVVTRHTERPLPASGRTAQRSRSGLQVLLWAVAGVLLACCLGLFGLLWYRQRQAT